MNDNSTRPLAVVTGASSGIGFELAKQFAEHGFDLVLAAEDSGLAEAADEVRAHGAGVHVVRADLATPEGVETLLGALAATGRPVEAAALNAGVGRGGAFLGTDLADELRVIDLNITSTVRLAKGLLPGMVARDQGRLLFTSSIAATVPGTFHAVYNATKSFVQSFAQALHNELKDTGVTVTCLMPGATETPFFHRAGMDDTQVGRQKKDDPAQVARQGFEALMAGRKKIVAGSAKTRAQGLVSRVVPDGVKAAAHRRAARPDSGAPK
ncbi:SDR family NAD(P)-dependent oxidoreductase [Streptomyces albidochromogenes]|uniref:SDR family NAD(P)-dependent oxidoreductase n=1 Tax=Streptomyces albidochromogenes TaxID=329524 RepID=A0ABW6FMU5_9ACTN